MFRTYTCMSRGQNVKSAEYARLMFLIKSGQFESANFKYDEHQFRSVAHTFVTCAPAMLRANSVFGGVCFCLCVCAQKIS